MSYLAQMEQRMTRMDMLFRRAEALQYELNQLRESFGLSIRKSFDVVTPSNTAPNNEVANNVTSYVFDDVIPTPEPIKPIESREPSITELETTPTNPNVYEDIDIDSIIASMDLGIEL